MQPPPPPPFVPLNDNCVRIAQPGCTSAQHACMVTRSSLGTCDTGQQPMNTASSQVQSSLHTLSQHPLLHIDDEAASNHTCKARR